MRVREFPAAARAASERPEWNSQHGGNRSSEERWQTLGESTLIQVLFSADRIDIFKSRKNGKYATIYVHVLCLISDIRCARAPVRYKFILIIPGEYGAWPLAATR